MRRSNHQFRLGAIEAFETRIVPTVTVIGGIPFVPPGQISPSVPAPDIVTSIPGAGFTVQGDTLTPPLVNNITDHIVYLTRAVYTAPGGGSGPSENLRSQSLLANSVVTYAIPANAVNYQLPSFDVSRFDQTGPVNKGDHFTGDDDFQCDLFEAPDINGYAPNKLDYANLSNHLIVGELFNYSDTDQNDGHGKKK